MIAEIIKDFALYGFSCVVFITSVCLTTLLIHMSAAGVVWLYDTVADFWEKRGTGR